MKKILIGVLGGEYILFLPIQAVASESQNNPKAIEISYEDAQLLMNIAWAEAGNQGQEGQRYVMSVVLNRVASPDFPDNIHDVVYQPHQFYTKGLKNAAPTSETHMALAEIEMGNIVPEIVAFETLDNDALDKYFVEAFEYKDHKFYTAKGK